MAPSPGPGPGNGAITQVGTGLPGANAACNSAPGTAALPRAVRVTLRPRWPCSRWPCSRCPGSSVRRCYAWPLGAGRLARPEPQATLKFRARGLAL